MPSKSPSERVSVSQDKILALGAKRLLNRKIGALRRIVAATKPLHVRNAPDARPHTRAWRHFVDVGKMVFNCLAAYALTRA